MFRTKLGYALWGRVSKCLHGVCRFCIMQYVIHIFVRWGNGPLYEVTSLGDWHEVINAALWLVVCSDSNSDLTLPRNKTESNLQVQTLGSSRLPFIKIQLRAAVISAKLHWANYRGCNYSASPVFSVSSYHSPTFSSKWSFVSSPHLVLQDLLLVLISGAEMIIPLVY